MSVAASIDFRFLTASLTAAEILVALKRSGWSMRDEDMIMYLPLGDNERFDWQIATLSQEAEVASEIQAKSNAGELVGVVLVWRDSGSGGQFLIYPEGSVTFQPSVNRKLLSERARITDASWYVVRLLDAFETSGLRLESVTWTDVL